MLGAVAGDIIGSPFEWNNTDDRYFDLCHSTRGWYRGREISCHPKFTDDTVLTLAVASWLMKDREHNTSSLIRTFREFAERFPDRGYGPQFLRWLGSDNPRPTNSYGNGAAMRVSPIGLTVEDLSEAIRIARQSAEITHSHPDGIKGAEAMVQAVWMAKHGRSKDDIRFAMEHDFGYDLSARDDELSPLLKGFVPEPIVVNGEETGGVFLRDTGRISTSASLTVTAALIAFMNGDSFEDVVRRAVALGGDSDTICSMAGAVAEPFYGGVPEKITGLCDVYITPDLKQLMNSFEHVHEHKDMRNGRIEKREDDSFGVIKVKGQPATYIVSAYRKELIEALKRKFGEDVRIINPSQAQKVIEGLKAQEKSGTYIENPRPDVKTLWYQNGEFRCGTTREGKDLPSRADREAAMRSFLVLHDYALEIKRQLQAAVGYTGEGSIHFENAYYPEVFSNRVEVWRGDCFAGAVCFDTSTGQLRVDIGGDSGPQEHGQARTFSVFYGYDGTSWKEAIARFCIDEGKGIESAQYETNIDIANRDVANSKDEALVNSLDSPALKEQSARISK